MIRLLIAGLLLSVSSLGWASAYPDKYEGVPKTFKDGDTIKAEDFNNNNESIKQAINSISSGTATTGATGPAGEKGDKGDTGPTGPAGADSTVPGPPGAVGADGAAGANGTDGVTGLGTATNWANSGDTNCSNRYLGEIILVAGSRAVGTPANGQTLDIASNSALFSVLGTTHGGNGTSTFNLPDLRSVAPNSHTYGICTTGIYPSMDP